jgi:hypothetical protein
MILVLQNFCSSEVGVAPFWFSEAGLVLVMFWLVADAPAWLWLALASGLARAWWPKAGLGLLAQVGSTFSLH